MSGFILPPKTKNGENKIRKAGFEIEYSGLTLTQTAAIIIKIFGGKITKKSVYCIDIKDTILGDFYVYIDSKFLREFEDKFKDFFEDAKELEDIENILLSISEAVVPYEIVTPPVPFDKLKLVENLRLSLKEHGALGTKASPFFAFGLHINIEAFSFETKEILDILRAFLILYEWIKEKSEVDLTRKLTWFIDPFDNDYIMKIMDLNYAPNKDEFINDYLLYNPTRNRALDLLPLLSFMDKSVKEKLPHEKINPRPAYHYRLPNSKLDEEDWSIAKEFNYWSLVEHLSFKKELLYSLCEEYFEFLDSPFWFITSKWIEKIDEVVKKEFKEFY